MAVTYDPIPGKTNVISITSPSVILPVNRYALDINGELIDITAFTSEGYREFMDGLISGSVILGGLMTRSWNPFRQAPVLKARTRVTNVNIKLGDGFAVNMPYAWVTRWQCDGAPAGGNSYVVSFQADGPFKDFSGSNA